MPAYFAKIPVWIKALAIVALVEIPFVLSIMAGPHAASSVPGTIFFSPAIGVLDLVFSGSASSFVQSWFWLATLVLQTLLLIQIVWWGLTWLNRPPFQTILWMTLLIGFMTIPALLGTRNANLENQNRKLTYEVSHQSAVDSLRSLNAALARYKAVMGKYPASMEQLSSPDDCSHPPDCNRFLEDLKFLPAEKYFTLRYRVNALGYAINADARSGNYQSLGHYFTDQTGIIRYDERDANAKSRYVPEDARITFN